MSVEQRPGAPERVIVLVMDSAGVGELPDAGNYGDVGANTLLHVAQHNGGFDLPTLQRLGLGNIIPLPGMPPAQPAAGAFGKCAELSAGKDTSTGHWEMAGLRIDKAFPVYENGFPEEILAPFRERTGRQVLGNKPASGTVILDELGEEHMRTGALIVVPGRDVLDRYLEGGVFLRGRASSDRRPGHTREEPRRPRGRLRPPPRLRSTPGTRPGPRQRRDAARAEPLLEGAPGDHPLPR